MKKYSIHLSIVAVILAFIALGSTLFQNRGKEWDSVMFAVAMLSGIVMILIGWNIYNALDFEKKIKRGIEEQASLIAKENYKYRCEAIGTALFNIGEATLRLNDYGIALNLYIKAVSELNNEEADSEEILLCFDRIDSIITELRNGGYEVKMPKKEQEKYIEMLSMIKSTRKNLVLKFLLNLD